MLDRVTQRQRSKRRVSVKIQLSKQDLQEYLDDGYTAADIAKDFNVSSAIINEKIRKFGVKRTKQTKVVKKRGRPTSTKKQKPRGRPPRRQPPRRQPPSNKGKTNLKEQVSPSKQDIQTVVTQVIQDNPEEAVDHIHDLLKFMGFDVAKSYVDDHLKKWKASSDISHKQGQKCSKQDDASKESCENGEQTQHAIPEKEKNESDGSQATDIEDTRITEEPQTDDKFPESLQLMRKKNEGDEVASMAQKGEVSLENQVDTGMDGFDSKNEPSIAESVGKRRPGRPRKIRHGESLRAEPVKRRGPGRPRKIQGNEAQKAVSKRGPGRPRKSLSDKPNKRVPIKIRRPGRPRKTPSNEDQQIQSVKRPRRGTSNKKSDGDTDTNANSSDEDEDGNTMEDSSDMWSDDGKMSKRGRKRGRKRKTKTIKNGPASRRGRPCLNLSVENLKLCVESGLPVGKIAEALGTCRQSVNRYLQVYKMRRKDRFSNLSNDELDMLVSEMCRDHPEWGQVRIQEELAKKGLHFRRNQIRNSVRRVDPVGIELRKLNNLKMRWNRGSLNSLDKILPADGINMTSKESFITQPPRNGLNGLNEEDSVRLLKSIVTTHKKTYVEPTTHKLIKQTQNPTATEKSPDSEVEQFVLKDEQEKQMEEGLMKVAQEVENTKQVIQEAAKEINDEENIGLESNHQHDLRIEAPHQSSSEDNKESVYRDMLYHMVMSTQKSDREKLPPTEDPAVTIPKEELEKCVEDGFSSSRIAEKFGTTIANVRRHLTMYKLAMSTRFEKISEERLDEIVQDVIKEFSIRKGSEVYGYVREKGFRIRKVDIHKSVSRLYPKGLHRKGSSIVQQSWDAASAAQPSEAECTETQEEGQGNEIENGGGASETVVMLNSEELAQLINGDGTITLVEQQGPLSNSGEGVHVTEIANSVTNTIVTTEHVQQTVKAQEDEISAIIVEIGLPQDQAGGVKGQVADQVDANGDSQITQYDAAQQPSSQEVVVVVTEGADGREHISNVVAVNTIPTSSGGETNGDGLNM